MIAYQPKGRNMMGPPGMLGRKCDNKQGERHCAAEALLQEWSNVGRAHGSLISPHIYTWEWNLVPFCTLWSTFAKKAERIFTTH